MTNIEIIRAVNTANPTYLRINNAENCYKFAHAAIEALRAEGREAYHVLKTQGEGQFTPVGFTPFEGPGLNGLNYRYTGVSHDAAWCDGLQVDMVGNGNDGPDPLGTPGTPTWNEIPQQYWRPNNPAWKSVVPAPPVVVTKPYPGDDFFRHSLGTILQADYLEAKQYLNDGASVWFARTIWDYVNGGLTIEASIAKHRKEWRAVLNLPVLP